MKIGAKAVLLFGAIAIVPAVVLLPIVLPDYADALIRAAQYKQIARAQEMQGVVEGHVGDRLREGRRLASTIASASQAKSDAEGELAVQLAFASQELFDVVRLVIVREGAPPTDQVFAKAGADRALAPAAPADLLAAASSAGFAAGPSDDRTWTLVFALPALAPNVRAYLVAPLYVQPLDVEIDRLLQIYGAGGLEILVVERDRRLVAGGTETLRTQRAEVASACATELLVSAPSGAATSKDCGDVVGTIHSTESFGWKVLVLEPRDVVLEEYDDTRRTLLIAAGVASLLAIALAVLAGRGVTRPVLRLVEQSRRLGARAWDRLLEHSRRGDELGELETALIDAGTSLQTQEQALAKEARVRGDLTRFLSPELVERAMRGDLDMKLGGRRREISVLFADVVAFTPLAEKRPAEEAVAILNELFALLTEIVFRHGGFVDKFIGDAVMAVFGAPDDAPDHADRALRCAEDIMRFLEVAKDSFEANHNVTIRLSLGINSGEAVVGNVGSEQRMDYTAIGDVVNIAARLESLATPNQVLVAEGTRERAKEPFELRRLGARRLVGREEDTIVYELVVD